MKEKLKGLLKNSGKNHSDTEREKTWLGVTKSLILRLAVSALIFLTALLLPLEAQWGMLLMLVSFLVCGYDILCQAIRDMLKEQRIGEELVISVASVLAFTISAAYEGAAVMLIYRFGDILRDYAGELSRGMLFDPIDPYPYSVTVLSEEENHSVPFDQIAEGDIYQIQPGDRIPTDGEIVYGTSLVDVGTLSGKSDRKELHENQSVYAGWINASATLQIRAAASSADSICSRAVVMATDESFGRGAAVEIAERYSQIFAPFALGATALTALLLLIFSDTSMENALHRAVVLLIMACPASVLAPLPIAYLSGIISALCGGTLIKGAAILDVFADTEAIVFNKTDMLPVKKMRVLSVKSARMDHTVLLKVAAHAASRSVTAIGRSVSDAYDGVIDTSLISDFTENEDGLTATMNGIQISVGNRSYMDSLQVLIDDAAEGASLLYMALNGQYAGYISLAEVIEPEALHASRAIQSTGCDCIMLSTDNVETSRAAAEAAGIREYYPECSDNDRISRIDEIKERCPDGSVLYLGLGTTDEDFLSAADLGVCTNGLRSEESLQTGGIVTYDPFATSLADAMDAARNAKKKVRQILLAVLAVKIVIFLLALLGITYQLWFAMLVDIIVGVAGILYAPQSTPISLNTLGKSNDAVDFFAN